MLFRQQLQPNGMENGEEIRECRFKGWYGPLKTAGVDIVTPVRWVGQSASSQLRLTNEPQNSPFNNIGNMTYY